MVFGLSGGNARRQQDVGCLLDNQKHQRSQLVDKSETDARWW